jgi:hypothetical protein
MGADPITRLTTRRSGVEVLSLVKKTITKSLEVRNKYISRKSPRASSCGAKVAYGANSFVCVNESKKEQTKKDE